MEKFDTEKNHLKILVTGGCGFIGRHLVRGLEKKGYKVKIYDNLSNSIRNSSKKDDDKISFIKGDILEIDNLSNALSDCNFVIHLAAMISVKESIKDPTKTYMINVEGTKKLLQACLQKNIKNLIAISSAAVYGENEEMITEESPTNPVSPYGKSKLIMEKEIINFSKKHKINSIILRIFNVYGTGQSDEYTGVITKFIENIRRDKPIEIYGDGTQTRDFISIEDVVESILNSIENIVGKRGRIFNIASGKSEKIKDVAQYIVKSANKDFKINYQRAKKGDIKKSQTKIERAKEELGFTPITSLKSGIKKLVKISEKKS